MPITNKTINWFDKSDPQVGTRVACIAAAGSNKKKGSLYNLGKGYYIGMDVPAEEDYPQLHALGFETAIIEVDGKGKVYGFECCWFPEEMLEPTLAKTGNPTLVDLSVEENRKAFQEFVPRAINKAIVEALDILTQLEYSLGQFLVQEFKSDAAMGGDSLGSLFGSDDRGDPEGGLLN